MTATTTTYSSVSAIVLLSISCVGLAMMFVGGWYFQSSLVELKAQQQADWYFKLELKTQQQENAKLMQQLKDTVDRQNKQIIELQFQLQHVSKPIAMIIIIASV